MRPAGSSPVLECWLRAASAYPWKGPVRRPFAALREVLAPRIGPDRIDRLPDHLELSVGVDLADHRGLGKMVVRRHDLFEPAGRPDPLAIHRLPNRIDVSGPRLD